MRVSNAVESMSEVKPNRSPTTPHPSCVVHDFGSETKQRMFQAFLQPAIFHSHLQIKA